MGIYKIGEQNGNKKNLRGGAGQMGSGIAQGALEYTMQYVKDRKQFGRPLAANQGVQFMIADMATAIDAAQLLVYRAACLKDQGLPHNKEPLWQKHLQPIPA